MVGKLRIGGLYRVKQDAIHFNKTDNDNLGVIKKINCPIYKNSIFMVLRHTLPDVIGSAGYFIVLYNDEVYGRYIDFYLADKWFEEVF